MQSSRSSGGGRRPPIVISPFTTAERCFRISLNLDTTTTIFGGGSGQRLPTTTAHSVDQNFVCRFAAPRSTCACCARDIRVLTLLGAGAMMVWQCRPCASRILRLSCDRGRVKRVDRIGMADLDPESRALFVIGARFEGFSLNVFLHNSSNGCPGSTPRQATTAFLVWGDCRG